MKNSQGMLSMYMFELLGKNGTLVSDQGVLLIAHCSTAARESFEGKKSWRRERVDWRVILECGNDTGFRKKRKPF